ncbi:MAG: extracellular solute-binding protein [Bifidobacteriaceae bacterium]|nr:extracellular solute-binding protein [Bifidobacteriaceae bacterium]
MKRIVVVAVAAIGLTWGLTACGGGGSTNEESPGGGATGAETDAPARAEADLVIWADANRTKALEAPLKAWADKNGLTAQVQTVATDLQANFVTANEAKNGPDVVIGAQDWTGKLVQNSAIVPVQISATGVSQTAIDAVSYGGQTYGAPYAIETLGLFVNNALTANPAPATIEDMIAAGQAGGGENVLCLQVGESGDAYHMQPLFTSGGGYIFGTNADGTYNTSDIGIGGAGGVAAATKIGELGAQGILKNSITGDNSQQLFNEGKCAYLVSGPWALADIRSAGIDFTLSPIPGFAGLGQPEPPLGVQAFFVASNAKNPAFAQQFVSDLLADTTITKAMNDVDARVPVQEALAAELKASDPVLMQFLDLAETAKAMPNIPAMEAVWGPLGQAEAAVVGGADPASTMQAAGQEVASSVQ